MKFLWYLYGQKLNDILFPRTRLLRSCIVNTAVYCTKHPLSIHAWNKFRLHWQQIVLICYLMWTTTCKPFIRITSALTKYSTHFKSPVGLKSDFISKSVISSPLYFKLYWSCIVCKLHFEVRRLKAYSVQIINIKRAAIAAAPFTLKSWQGKPHVTPCCQLPGHWTINILRYVCFIFLHANTCLNHTDFRPNCKSEKYFWIWSVLFQWNNISLLDSKKWWECFQSGLSWSCSFLMYIAVSFETGLCFTLSR